MREFLLIMLLAGVASPALAAQDSDGTPNRARNRAERAQGSDAQRPERPVARPQRDLEPSDNPGRSDAGNAARSGGPADRDADGTRVERVAPVERIAPAERVAPAERRAAGGEVRRWRQDSDAIDQTVRKPGRTPTLPHRPAVERGNDAAAAGDTVRNWRARDRDVESVGSTIEDRNMRTAPNARDGGFVQSRRPLPRVMDPERRISPTPILGTEPPAPRTAVDRRAQPATRWSTDWRHDRRYDWHDWRRRHRNRFHFGFYSDPFGWDYFRYGIGWRLWPSYYRSSYWLRDPWHYRLPPAYGPYRWIRYHGDALLVNIYTGNVVDVVYGFFW